MQVIKRDCCVYSGNKDLELLYSFKDFPVFMGCVEHPPELDITADMNWYVSKSTGSLQLNPLLPLDVLYQEQHADSVGQTWAEHHQKFAEFIVFSGCRSIFEIGGAHGILARNVQKLKPDTDWVILEPNPKLIEGTKVKVIKGFFDKNFTYNGTFDAVVHSMVFEHVYFPSEFISKIAELSPVGTYHIFSAPNTLPQLQKFYTNCLNFEHTFLLIEPYIEPLLENNGFEIIKKEYFLDYGIFYKTRKIDAKSKTAFPNLYDQNKSLFNNFIQHHCDSIHDLNQQIAQSKQPVYLFGGHIFSLFLLHFGLNADKIICILDNSTAKQEKRLYGTNMQVNSPKILKDLGPVNIILKAGAYNEEIKADILKNINPDVIFWE